MNPIEFSGLITDLHAIRSNIAAKLPPLQAAGMMMLAVHLESARDSITRAIAELNETSRPAELTTAPAVPQPQPLSYRKQNGPKKTQGTRQAASANLL